MDKIRKGRKNLGRQLPELVPVGQREPPQDRLALGGDLEEDFPMVELVADAAEDAEVHHPVDQADDRMVLELELPGQRSDRGEAVRRQALDAEEKLVLLRLQSFGARRILAEDQEPADQMAEARERRVVGFDVGRAGRHGLNVSYYDIKCNGCRRNGSVGLARFHGERARAPVPCRWANWGRFSRWTFAASP